MDQYLLEPLEEVMNKFEEALRAKNYRTHEEMMPLENERQLVQDNPGYKQDMCSLLVHISEKYYNVDVVSSSPTSTEIAQLYLEEINLMEQRLRNLLPGHLKNIEAKEFKFIDRHHLVDKCFYADLWELKTAMRKKYDHNKAAKKTAKNKQKKEKREKKKKQALQQQQEVSAELQNLGEVDDDLDKVNVETEQVSVGPEIEVEAEDGVEKEDVVIEKVIAELQNLGEADDGLDKVIVETKEVSVGSEIEVEADDGVEKEDVVIEKTCILNPNTNFMHYSPGESTNYSTNIFKGKLSIFEPSSTIDNKTIPIMYFTMDEHAYEMSGFQWPNFSLRYPSKHILSVYGVGKTMDDQIFIACETLEQPLETWLEDREHFSIIDKPLSSTLKSFFKDVINGAMHVHKQSEGSLEAELAINNVFICNGRAKLSLLRQVEPSSDTIASFRRMVVKEVFKTQHEHIPVELMHLLDYMKKNRWHPTCMTHPVFFSASQTCIYAKLACERIHACESGDKKKIGWELNRAARTIEALHFDKAKWITRVKHEVLLMVLKFKKDEVNSFGAGNDKEDGKTVEESVDEESDVLVEEKVEGDQVDMTSYVGNGYSFLVFFRNVVVQMKKGILTDEELVFEMNNILPNFLLCVYEVLTDNHVFVTVGEDLH